jgi:hypothetical protein
MCPVLTKISFRLKAVETYVYVGFDRSAQVATYAERMQPVQSLTCAELAQIGDDFNGQGRIRSRYAPVGRHEPHAILRASCDGKRFACREPLWLPCR